MVGTQLPDAEVVELPLMQEEVRRQPLLVARGAMMKMERPLPVLRPPLELTGQLAKPEAALAGEPMVPALVMRGVTALSL